MILTITKKKFFIIQIAGILFLLSTTLASAKPPPVMSGTLSVIPGLGQVANGDYTEGLAWFAGVIASYTSKNKSVSQAGFDLWMYNVYDAYRDAGARGAAKYSLIDNYIATFNPINLIDPVSVTLDGFAALTNGNSSTGKKVTGVPKEKALRPLVYGFVGLGEEGLFRGFLYPELSHASSSKLFGAISSSVIFAYFHVITNGRAEAAAKYIIGRTVLGLVLCLQTSLNHNDLRKSIFAHAWYDFLVERNTGGSMITTAKGGYKWEF